MESRNFCLDYRKSLLRYLDKNVTAISAPMDVIRIFAGIKKGRRNLWLALRNLFNYHDILGFDNQLLDSLRKAMPRCDSGIDLKVPDEKDIIQSLQKVENASEDCKALYNLLVDSGLRLVEAVKVSNEFEEVEKVNDFCRVVIGEFRGSKQAYYAYFSETTHKMLKSRHAYLNAVNASAYFDKNGLVSPKYIRKFVFDKMIELEIPESVADFIEGRVATRIGAKHYMVLSRQANGFYGKYAEYIKQLRTEAGLKSSLNWCSANPSFFCCAHSRCSIWGSIVTDCPKTSRRRGLSNNSTVPKYPLYIVWCTAMRLSERSDALAPAKLSDYLTLFIMLRVIVPKHQVSLWRHNAAEVESRGA